MADTTITQLPAATTVNGTDQVPIVQDGTTKSATVAQIQAAVSPLNYDFITVGSDPSLPNSRTLGAQHGLTVVDNGAGQPIEVETQGTLRSLADNVSSGILVNDTGSSVTNRTLVAPAAGFTIANADGVSGNPTFTLSDGLSSLENLLGLGFVATNGTDSYIHTGIYAGQAISVTNGDGSTGTVTIGVSNNPTFLGSYAVTIPKGTTGQRPSSGTIGQLRANTDSNMLEYSDAVGNWYSLAAATSIPLSNLLPSGEIYVGNALGFAAAVSVSGDATLSNAGALTVGSIGGKSVTLGGSVTTAGAFPLTLTTTASTSVTLPVSGTLLNDSLASANIYVGNGSGVATGVAMSGDAGIANTGAVTVSKIGGTSVSLGGPLSTAGAVTFSGAFGTTINVGALTNITLPASGTLLNDSLTSANIYVGNGSNVATGVAMSGDVTISNVGVTAIGDNKVQFSQLTTSNAGTLVGNFATSGVGNLSAVAPSSGLTMASGALAVVGRMPENGFPVDTSGNYLVAITYNETTRTVTIAPTGATFDVYVAGAKYTKAGPQSVTHDTAYGGKFIYYDNTGTLVASNTPWDYAQTASACYVFWDSVNSRGLPLFEVHHADVDPWIHRRLHDINGTQVYSGFTLGGYTPNVASDAAISFSVTSGVLEDEDIKYTTDALADDGPYVIMQKVGATASNWQFTRTSAIPVLQVGNILQYNQNNVGTWRLSNVSNTNYVNYYVFGTTALSATSITPNPGTCEQIFIIPGQAQYTSLGSAQAESVASLTWDTFPFSEAAALYQITFQYKSGNGGTAKATIEAVTRLVGSVATVTSGAPSGLSTVLNSANIFVGSAANVATGVAMSGDATIDNTGAVTLTPNTSRLIGLWYS